MVLHTIINSYDIFACENDILPVKYSNIENGIIEYYEKDNNKHIVRLHSTDPYMYLKSEFQPYSLFK